MLQGTIYLIRNLKTNRFYLGRTINSSKRKSTHFKMLQKGTHHSKYLQRSALKHGIENFVFEEFFKCLPDDLEFYEAFFLKTLRPAYNVSLDSLAPMTGRTHSFETKKKMSIDRKANPSRGSLGMKLSQSTRDLMSKIKIGSKRTDETKDKMRETANRINSIARIDRTKSYRAIVSSDGLKFESLVSAAKHYSISVQAICDNLKGRSSKTKNGLTFKYGESFCQNTNSF